MVSLLSMGTSRGGGGRRRVGAGSDGGAAAPVKQLLRRLLRCRLSAGRPGRAAVRFGYDLQSYSRNFDDGIGSSGHRF
ncbi:hypothetical protein PAHAL_9G227900 [Panicum hallii]|jgi:hypothetical protein|uniref:Uncharacterized protein n=1 Tax=Panicum hallii TaxID=206008 RepID=A0A2S3ILM5_9POAL|nr:hypothetical protein PAHAL_9G227900 [Panicum hallii]